MVKKNDYQKVSGVGRLFEKLKKANVWVLFKIELYLNQSTMIKWSTERPEIDLKHVPNKGNGHLKMVTEPDCKRSNLSLVKSIFFFNFLSW